MEQKDWKPGDTFRINKNTFGMVIDRERAIIMEDTNMMGGGKFRKEALPIPYNAEKFDPDDLENDSVAFEVKFALSWGRLALPQLRPT